MSYEEALDYLDSFLNYEIFTAYRYPEAFSLDRMGDFLERLGHPERTFPAIHVAGTKGKGSTCAFAASILKAAGFRVGLYTSPHLVCFRERIRIDGEPIGEEDLARAVSRIRPKVIQELTFFEVTTACAFAAFAERKVDAAVVEVGLGGRLDATNLLLPEVTVVTPISLDHMTKLGGTLPKIAREKAGILKAGVPLVLALQPAPALRVFRGVAAALRVPVHHIEEQARVSSLEVRKDGTGCAFETPMGIYPDLQIPLMGRHQVANAACAVRATELFAQKGKSKISVRAVQEGLAQTKWPGRCQLIPGRPPILLDGAQNAASARALRETVEELFPGKRICLVVGISLDKDLAGIAKELGPWAGRLILTRADVPRAESPEKLAQIFQAWHAAPFLTESVDKALDQAREIADPEGMIVVTGSLFVVGEAMQRLIPLDKLPGPPSDPAGAGRATGPSFGAAAAEKVSRR